MLRREWLKKSALLTGGLMTSLAKVSKSQDTKTILLISGWQYANIGDIAHTPGLLTLLTLHLPNVQVILWPNHQSREIDHMLLKNFPNLQIVYGTLNEAGEVDSAEVTDALQQADFCLHGSGPSVVGSKKLYHWKKQTNKPYGIYGVTVSYVNDFLRPLISEADFIFTRETASLDNLQQHKVSTPIRAFAPDATFSMTLQNPSLAFQFMSQHDLQPKEFICTIPRLRKTPYYKIYDHFNWSQERIREVNDLNEQHAEKDHKKLRDAMVTYVRNTGHKVVVCPEMTYQLDIMDELLIDPLPVDVKKRVVKKDTYWMPDEAGSLYSQALAVLSFECHSPIIAAVNGTPCFYLRQPEDTIKGQMWYDIGLDQWVFEIEETLAEDISRQLMKVYDDYTGAKKYLANAMKIVHHRQESSLDQVAQQWLV